MFWFTQLGSILSSLFFFFFSSFGFSCETETQPCLLSKSRYCVSLPQDSNNHSLPPSRHRSLLQGEEERKGKPDNFNFSASLPSTWPLSKLTASLFSKGKQLSGKGECRKRGRKVKFLLCFWQYDNPPKKRSCSRWGLNPRSPHNRVQSTSAAPYHLATRANASCSD